MIKEQKSETPYHKGDTKMDYNKLALEMHEQNKGKIAVRSKVTVKTRDDLSTAYTHQESQNLVVRSVIIKKKYTAIQQKEI